MNRFKSALLGAALITAAVPALYACGGDTPTATLVAPTATTAPPSPTSAPPTAVPPTSTVASGGGATSSTPSGSGSDQVQIVTDAVTALSGLTSYHYEMILNPTDYITQAVHLQGDYVAPNLTTAQGTIGNQTIDQIVVGSNTYEKDASGKYVLKVDNSAGSGDLTASLNPQNFVSGGNPLSGIDSILNAGTGYNNAGTETLDGVSTQHWTYNLDLMKMLAGGGASTSSIQLPASLPPLGSGGIWIDPSTKYAHRISLNMDMSALLGAMAAAFASFMTPEPGASPTVESTPMPSMSFDITMNISKQNDPSIKINLPPEIQAAESAASTPSPAEMPTTGTTGTGSATDTPASALPTQGSGSSSTPAATDQEVAMGTAGSIEGLNLTVNSTRREDKGLMDPSAGNDYLIVNLTIENTTKDAQAVSSLLQFSVLDSTGKSYDISVTPNITQFDSTTNGNIAAGAKVTGEVGFEVPKTAGGFKFVYSTLLSSSKLTVKLDK